MKMEGGNQSALFKFSSSKQWLEDLVVNQTMQLVKDDAAMESIIAKVMELQDRENTNLPLYEKQLRDAESGIQNMLNAIQAGILTSSTKERLEQLEETKRELKARIAEEKLAKPKVTEEFIRFWLLRFRKLDMSLKDQRQALVDTFINAIYLYDNKVLITFNYKEGTQTVTFGEASEIASEGNGSDLDCIPALLNDSFQKGCRFSFLHPSFWKHSAMRIRGLEQHNRCLHLLARMPDAAVIRLPGGWHRSLLPRLRHKEPLHVDVFHPQQFFLFVDAARIAGQAAVRSDDPVARDEDRDPIVPDGTAHCLCRHAEPPLLFRQLFCQCAVGRGLAVGDLQQQLPHRLPERRPHGMERRGEARLPAAEIDLQPAFCLLQDGRFLRRVVRVQTLGKIQFAVEPKPCQAHIICRQQNAAQRGIVMQCVHHSGYLLPVLFLMP